MILLLGTVAWVLLWVFLYSFKNTFYYEALRTGFTVVLIADLATMAYLYKSYYGRFIFHELDDPTAEQEQWKFNQKTKKYEEKTVYDKRIDDYEKRKAFNKYLDQLEAENKKINLDKITAAIVKNKNQQQAAKYLQRWWRNRHHKTNRASAQQD